MFDILTSFMRRADAHDVTAETYAIDLLTRKVAEAESGIAAARQTVTALIVRQRAEQKALEAAVERRRALEDQARLAIIECDGPLALHCASLVTCIEHEIRARTETILRIDERTMRLRLAVERAHRRMVDLRQSAITARALELERRNQRTYRQTATGGAAFEEAQILILRVAEQEDPLAFSDATTELDQAPFSWESTEEAEAVEVEQVLARLKAAA